MTDPARIALYLRVIAGEVEDAKDMLPETEDESAEILDAVMRQLYGLADTIAVTA